MMKNSYSMALFPINNGSKGVSQIGTDALNYTYQNTNQILVSPSQIIPRNKSSSYFLYQEQRVKTDPSSMISIVPMVTTSHNISAIDYNNLLQTSQNRMMKKSLIRQKFIPKSTKITLNLQNKNNTNLSYLEKYNINISPSQINLNKINNLENSKNDSSLYRVKPEGGLFYSYQALVSPKRKKNTVLKIPLNHSLNNKIFEQENNIKNKIINNNYANYMNNVSKLNHFFDLNYNKTNINGQVLKEKNKLNDVFSEQNLAHSKSHYFYNYINKNNIGYSFIINNPNNGNNSSSQIKIDNALSTSNINNKIKSFKEVSNNPYFINSNKENLNSYIGNKNSYNTYNINSNNNKIFQYIKVNTSLNNLEPDQNLNLSEFIKIKQIGQGTEGIIYSVKWLRNNKIYALKHGQVPNLESVKSKQVEINMLKNFRNKTGSDGVIKIYGQKFIFNKSGYYDFYEIMEFAEKDWEQEIIYRGNYRIYYTEDELMTIMAKIVRTLSLLQQNHITHRDIKPQNIMIFNGKFKISDFGNARLLKKEGFCFQRIRGSEMYMSPIMFKGFHSKLGQVKHNTYKSDVFSLGMCFLLAAALSFNPLNTIRELYDVNAIYNVIYYYLGNRYSQNVLKILISMLQVEENERPDFIKLESLFPRQYFTK